MSRSSSIPTFFNNKLIRIYKGHRWNVIKISDWHAGFKFGEFAPTRKYVKYAVYAKYGSAYDMQNMQNMMNMHNMTDMPSMI